MSIKLFVYALLLVNFVTSGDRNFDYVEIKKEHTNFTFQGLMAPVFTPFYNDKNRTLNLFIISDYAKFLASKNITGVLIGGTTGEGTSLSINERKQLVETWANAVKGTKQHLMVQIGGAALVDVKELAAHAENLHVDSLLCLPDLYFKPTKTEDLIEYFRDISQSAPNTPLLYYQSTKAKVNVKVQDFLKSGYDKIPTLTGVKLDSSDIKDGIDALAVNDKLTVIYGSKMIISAGCSIGVQTFMSATLNFIPELSFQLLDFCHGKINLKTAQQIQGNLQKIEKKVMEYGGYVETMKTAMSLTTGLFMGPVRAPLKILSQENIKEMEISLRNVGLETNKPIPYKVL